MINLEEISRRVDALIESESSFDLTKWLLNRREEQSYQILGEGSFTSITVKKSSENHIDLFFCTEVEMNIIDNDSQPSLENFLAA